MTTRLQKRMANIEQPKFFDEYGLLNTQPGAKDDNGILFLAEYVIRYEQKHQKLPFDADYIHAAIYGHQTSRGVFAQTPEKLHDPASHDNVTAIVYLSLKYNLAFHKELKIFGKFWHPEQFYFYGRAKYDKLYDYATLFMPALFAYLSHALACIQKTKSRPTLRQKIEYWRANKVWLPTGKLHKTDGKFLMWVTTATGMFPRTYKTCNKILTKMYGHDWKKVIIDIYFANPNHPLRLL